MWDWDITSNKYYCQVIAHKHAVRLGSQLMVTLELQIFWVSLFVFCSGDSTSGISLKDCIVKKRKIASKNYDFENFLCNGSDTIDFEIMIHLYMETYCSNLFLHVFRFDTRAEKSWQNRGLAFGDNLYDRQSMLQQRYKNTVHYHVMFIVDLLFC